jgi:TetR/AcrR family transcriptional regulator
MTFPADPAPTDDAPGAPPRERGTSSGARTPGPDGAAATPGADGTRGAAAAAGVGHDGADAAGADEGTGVAARDATETRTETRTSAARKRPKPGERRVQILHTLAGMLEQPGSERVTTAALAARLSVSEAALYRHFASKAQMFEGLIEFIEQSVFTLVNQIGEREPDPRVQVQKVLGVVLQFGEKNPGMTRVMVGDALVFENYRLLARMNQFFDRIESQLRQSLRIAAEAAGSQSPTADANAQASVLTAFAVGRLQRYARSGFKRMPTEHLDAALLLMVA